MPKTKEQKQLEAASRLEARITDMVNAGQLPKLSHYEELYQFRYAHKEKAAKNWIYADGFPEDYVPTPEVHRLIERLNTSLNRFEMVEVSTCREEPYPYASYEGGGSILSRFVAKHTPFTLHHGVQVYGITATLIFSRPEFIPEFDCHDTLIRGVTAEQIRQNGLSFYQ